MKILVPTDFSTPCKKAINFTTFPATALKAELAIFHAVPLYSIWLEQAERKVLAAAEKKR